jgi:hypothetical protein
MLFVFTSIQALNQLMTHMCEVISLTDTRTIHREPQGNLTGPLNASSTCAVTIAALPANMPNLLSGLKPALFSTWLPVPIAAMALPWLHASRDKFVGHEKSL